MKHLISIIRNQIKFKHFFSKFDKNLQLIKYLVDNYNLNETENMIYLCFEPKFTGKYHIETASTNNIKVFGVIEDLNLDLMLKMR